MKRATFLTDTGIALAGAAAIGPARVAAETGSERYIVDGSDVSALTSEYLNMLAKARVDVLQWNSPEALLDMSLMYDFLDKQRDRVALVRRFSDIEAARK